MTGSELTQEQQAQFDHLLEMFGQQEDLDPELEEYVSEMPGLGHKLMHPLVYHVPFSYSFSKMANKMLQQKQEALEQARAKENWNTFVFLHERPHRFDALMEVLDEHQLDDEVLWPLIAHVWTDSDNINQNLRSWQDVWLDSADQERRVSLCMNDSEQEAFRGLPSRFPVWRGVGHRNAVEGLSWTTDRAQAVWFARRYGGPNHTPILASGKVDKGDVLAHFLGRNEHEIVVFPDHVMDITTEQL